MMRWRSICTPRFAILWLVSPGMARAARLSAGQSVAWVGLHGNRAQLAGPFTGGPAGPILPGPDGAVFETGEVGLHLAYSYFLSNSWTFVLSGGFDVGRVNFEPKGGREQTYSSNSWNARIGFDRYAFINDEVALYAGPGIMYWTGSAEYADRPVPPGGPNINFEWPQVKQVGLNGRLGMYARFASQCGLISDTGQGIAHNTTDDGVGESSWASHAHAGSVGIAGGF